MFAAEVDPDIAGNGASAKLVAAEVVRNRLSKYTSGGTRGVTKQASLRSFCEWRGVVFGIVST